MKAKTYFDRTGKIYGVSSRYEFEWEHTLHVFTDYEKAEKWLNTESYHFCERELMSKTAAEKLVGKIK